jgi:anti-anti-sigma factor
MSVPQPGGLELDEQGSDASPTLALSGELDISTADHLQDTVKRLCATGGARDLTLDLRGLTFIDSSGLAAIVYAVRLCERHDCELSVIRGPQAVHEVLELTGLTELLRFRTDSDDSAPS